MAKKVIRNVPTGGLLLLLAQANAIGAAFVDVSFDTSERKLGIAPIHKDEQMKRFMEGKDRTDMDDIINED